MKKLINITRFQIFIVVTVLMIIPACEVPAERQPTVQDKDRIDESLVVPPARDQDQSEESIAVPTIHSQDHPDEPLAIPTLNSSIQQLQQTTVTVHIFQADYLQVAQLIKPLRFIDYDSFVWLELDDVDLATIENSGVNFFLEKDANTLFLNRFQFDPLLGEPQIPPEQMTSYAPGEEGFYLVQFFGPTKAEWLDFLSAASIVSPSFQPNHAYIVRMTPEQAVTVNEQDFVRWVGVYHAAYRIAPTLLEFEPPGPFVEQQIIQNVDITLYNNEQVQGVIATIQGQLGGELIEQYPMNSDGSLVTAIFALPSDVVVVVAQLNNVLWMNFRPPVDELEDEMSNQIIASNINPLVPGYQAWLATNGVNGAGVTVALVDSGYDTGNNATVHPDLQGRLIPVGTPNDTNGHGTHVGGIIAGNASLGTTDTSGYFFGLGVAPNTNLVVIDSTSVTVDANRTRLSVNNGAVASNNSYGLNSAGSGYSARDKTYDSLVRDADQTTITIAEPLIIVFSAGNSGTLGPTKEAKNIIAVGNSLNQRTSNGIPIAGVGNINTVAPLSSRGPAQDGRIYPHLTAPGTNIISTRSTQAGIFKCTLIPTGAPLANPTYSMCSGTSMAAPHVTGSVALITQWWRTFNAGANPSPAMAKALLINGAVDMGTANIPNNNEGWGRINLSNVINPPVPVIYQDQTTIFNTSGQTSSLAVSPSDPTQPLKVTLVWSDAPGAGSGGVTAELVNDLDLTVRQGSTIFLGNWFVNGWSATGGSPNRLDNIENVYIQNPVGVYNITVNATEINGNGVPPYTRGALPDQDFALVCFNCVVPADLSITKTDSPDPVTTGGDLNYTLNVTNGGPVDATGVTVTDSLPTGVTFVSATPSQGSCAEAAGVVTCDLGDLANGASATIALTVNTSSCGTVTNTAEVAGNEFDPNIADNSASADTTLICPADLSITKTDSPDPVIAGNNLAYTLTVFNNGPSDATEVTVSDTLPAGITFVSATPSQGSCFDGGGLVTCDLGDLANSASASITIVVTLRSSTPCDTTLTNTTEVTIIESDPDSSNNTASTDTMVICRTDLSISKSDSPDPVYTGSNLTYELIVSNNGPSDATGVTVVDNLPTEVTFNSATPSQGSCGEKGGIVNCDLGGLANGESAIITIIVTPISGGTITNTATVTGNETDPDSTNNTANASTTVILVVGVDIKPGNPNNPINPGSNGQFPVAILSSDGFDAPGEIDIESLTFGRTGNEVSLVSCQKNARDVNHDGLEDLVCHFYTQLTNLQESDTESILKGHTMEGILIEGRDSVRTVPR